MDKFSELKAAAMAATQGPWFRSSVQFNGITTEETFITQGNKPHLANTSEKRDAIFIAAANPAVVLALLAELEAKDEQNKLLMREIEHGKKLRVNMQNNADSLSERIAELEEQSKHLKKELHNEGAANAYAYERIRKLEKRLATPVRLPKLSGDEDLAECVFKYVAAIRAAGFTVEGDE